MTTNRQRVADTRQQLLRAVDGVQVQRDREAIGQTTRLDEEGDTP